MINILPYKEKKAIKRLRFFRMATVSLWAGSMLVASASLLFWPTLITVNSRFNLISGQMQKFESSGIVTKPVDVLNLEYRTKTIATKLAATVPPVPTYYIAQVKKHLISGVTLSGFTLDPATSPTLTIVGTAGTREQLQAFIAELKKDAIFATVNSPVSNFVKNSQSQFTVVVTFKTS